MKSRKLNKHPYFPVTVIPNTGSKHDIVESTAKGMVLAGATDKEVKDYRKSTENIPYEDLLLKSMAMVDLQLDFYNLEEFELDY